MTRTALHYQTGFGNEYASEAVPGALPHSRDNAGAKTQSRNLAGARSPAVTCNCC